MGHLIYPMSTEEPAIAGTGRSDNRHLRDLAESIMRNLGDSSDNANESGSSELETTPKSSDVSEESQRGHSTRSAGKPRTGGRATACEVGA
jgi:hypothetical protein